MKFLVLRRAHCLFQAIQERVLDLESVKRIDSTVLLRLAKVEPMSQLDLAPSGKLLGFFTSDCACLPASLCIQRQRGRQSQTIVNATQNINFHLYQPPFHRTSGGAALRVALPFLSFPPFTHRRPAGSLSSPQSRHFHLVHFAKSIQLQSEQA